MKDRKDIDDRFEMFQCMELPGQPMCMHMGTAYLVNDLYCALTETEAERDRLRKLAEKNEAAADAMWAQRDNLLRALVEISEGLGRLAYSPDAAHMVKIAREARRGNDGNCTETENRNTI